MNEPKTRSYWNIHTQADVLQYPHSVWKKALRRSQKEGYTRDPNDIGFWILSVWSLYLCEVVIKAEPPTTLRGEL